HCMAFLGKPFWPANSSPSELTKTPRPRTLTPPLRAIDFPNPGSENVRGFLSTTSHSSARTHLHSPRPFGTQGQDRPPLARSCVRHVLGILRGLGRAGWPIDRY